MILTFHFGSRLAVALLTVFATHTFAQTYAFTTVAGHAPPAADDQGNTNPRGSADGAKTDARFYTPRGVALDRNGNLFVADTYNHTIRKITKEGIVSTFAGQPGPGGGSDGTGGAARFFLPEGVAVDAFGNVFVADTGNNTIRRITADGTVTTIAGPAGGSYGTSGGFGSVDGVGMAARFLGPRGITIDASGYIFLGDSGNHTIRKISPAGIVTTVAGSAGSNGKVDGVASAARFDFPTGVTLDAVGNLYVADSDNNAIRRITPDGVVSTLAGGSLGAEDGVGRAARFNRPRGVAMDGSGRVIVADYGQVRIVSLGGVVTTLAGGYDGFGGAAPGSYPPYEASNPAVDGPGIAARFWALAGVAVDSGGNIFVGDSYNNAIRRVSADGVVSTFAGPGGSSGAADGPGDTARFYLPRGAAIDGAGNSYVADTANHTIRKIGVDGVVTTFAGRPGHFGSVDGTGVAARFFYPYGLAVDGAGNVFVADTHNHTIRKITAAGSVTTFAGLAGASGNADGIAGVARFNSPRAVAVDRTGSVFVADNGAVRKIAVSGLVTTLVTTIADNYFAFTPGQAVAVDDRGTVYFADGNRIRKLAPDGTITNLAGSPPIPTRGGDASYGGTDGPGEIARFAGPTGLAVDEAGNVFVADGAVRKISPGGYVTTIGGGFGGGADGTGIFAGFAGAASVAVGNGGAIIVVDRFNNRIRRGVPAVVPGRLNNFSILTPLAAGETLTMGTIIGGAGTTGNKPILARAAGPSLAPFGVTNLLADPKIEFYSGTTKVIEDDDWGGGGDLTIAFAQIGAFPFISGSKDAALNLLSIPVGNHTARVSGNGGAGGMVLAEVYDGTPVSIYNPSIPRLINLSVLKHLGPGLTAGFIIGGTSPMTVLIRAVGPSLAPFGVTNLLVDPRLELFDGQSRSMLTNDNWSGDPALAAAFASVGAFVLSDANSKDSALLITLTPGAYTVHVRSSDSTTGVVLVEVYEVP